MFGSLFLSRTFRVSLSTLAFSLFSACFIFLFPPIARASQVSLAWDPSTSPNVTGYKLYYGTSSKSYQFTSDAGNGTAITVSNLQEGTSYYFAVTAYDPTGLESDFSNEVAYNAPTATCTYAITPASQSVGFSSGGGTVSVSSQSGCAWTAVSNVAWVLITSNNSGMGSGAVNYSVSANSSASSRTGTVTVAGQTFTVTQSGTPQYTLSLTKSGTGTGTVAKSPGGTTFNAGMVVTLTATPDTNSIFAGWSGGCAGTSPTCTVTMNSSTSVTATFTLQTDVITPTLETYVITAKVGANGCISPMGSVRVNRGGSQSFTIVANRGYKISNVKVDGVSVGKTSTYLFGNVQAAHRIEASFASDGRGRNK